MVAASSSSWSPVQHHLLLPVLIALLAFVGHVAAAAGSSDARNAVVGKKSAVLSLRELEYWGTGTAAARETIQGRRYAQAKQAGFLAGQLLYTS